MLSSCEKPSLGLPDTLTDFKAEIEVLTPSVDDGNDFAIQVKANRSFVIEKLACEWEPKDLTIGSTCELSHDGTFGILFPSVSVAEDHIGTLEMMLYDEGTDRTVTLSADYMAYAHRIVYPSGIVLSRNKISVDWYDEDKPDTGIESFQVSMDPENAETGFVVEVQTGGIGKVSISTARDGEYSQKCSIESNKGSIYIKGGDTGGQVFLKVTSTSNPKAFAYVEVFVRHRVALMVYGSFYQNMWDPGHTNGMSPGWYGVPSSIKCRMVTWEIASENTKIIDEIPASNLDGLQLHNFSKLSGNYAASFRLSVFPEQRTYDQFFGPNGGDVAHLVINYNDQISATLPPSGQQIFSYKALPYQSESSLPEVCTAIAEINDNTHWVGYWWFLNIQGYYHTTEWTNVALTVDSIDYDRDRLDLRYCLYMFSACYSSGRFCGSEVYWWAAADHVPWIQRWQS